MLIVCKYCRSSYPDELLPDVGLVVGVWVVGVHELNGVEDSNGVQCIVVLVYVILHHNIEKIPSNVVVRRDCFVGIYVC